MANRPLFIVRDATIPNTRIYLEDLIDDPPEGTRGLLDLATHCVPFDGLNEFLEACARIATPAPEPTADANPLPHDFRHLKIAHNQLVPFLNTSHVRTFSRQVSRIGVPVARKPSLQMTSRPSSSITSARA